MIEVWSDFFVAIMGAAAVLVGLVFVGVSVNLSRVLEFGQLPDRALLALLKFSLVLVVSALGLVPDQGPRLLGIEWLILGVLSILWFAVIQIRSWQHLERDYHREQLLWNVLAQGAVLCVLLSGLLLLAGNSSGLYWMVPGILLCFMTAIQDAWVLLVEINR